MRVGADELFGPSRSNRRSGPWYARLTGQDSSPELTSLAGKPPLSGKDCRQYPHKRAHNATSLSSDVRFLERYVSKGLP